MRLLNVHTLTVTDFSLKVIPPYVIASHRWSDDEPDLADVQRRYNVKSSGYLKLAGLADYTKNNVQYLDADDYVQPVDWMWIDTCCIDKTNSVELGTAINSMFSFYRNAVLCLAYLADVRPHSGQSFERSVWFDRGWTLQELLAPSTVLFLDVEFRSIGHKGTQISTCLADLGPCLNQLIAGRTGIASATLLDFDAHRDISVEEKLAWLDGRSTTRPEDMTYCMLGILDVDMTIRYGGDNSGRKAQDRLEAKLEKRRRSEQHTHFYSHHTEHDRRRFVQRAQEMLVGHDAALINDELQSQVVTSLAQVEAMREQLTRLSQHLILPISRSPSASSNATLSSSSSYTTGEYPQRSGSCKAQPGKQVFRLKLACRWFSHQIYDIAILQATSGWNIYLRTYREVDLWSPMFAHCRKGDLPAMQELVKAGQASWLDRIMHGSTLLMAAVIFKQVGLFKFLLKEIDWPDKDEQLRLALSYAEHSEFYQLIFEEQGHEVPYNPQDIEESARVLAQCPSASALTILTRNTTQSWTSIPVNDRFEMLTMIWDAAYILTPQDLLDKLGMSMDDPSLKDVRRRSGATLLHFQAMVLYNRLERARSTRAQNDESYARPWVDFGVHLIHAGLDPLTTNTSGVTAMSDQLQDRISTEIPLIFRFLHSWLGMITRAGLVVEAYLKLENEALSLQMSHTRDTRYKRMANHIERSTVSQIMLDEQGLAVQVVRALTFRVYRLQSTPGSFDTGHADLPTEIFWYPKSAQRAEGVWKYVREVNCRPSEVVIREPTSHRLDALQQLHRAAQDDAGAVAILLERHAIDRQGRKRSSSVPPLQGTHDSQSSGVVRDWLPAWCLDNVGSTRRIRYGHSLGHSARIAHEPGLKGMAAMHHCWNWHHNSFLARIAQCQADAAGGLPIPSTSDHTGTTDCPRGCSNIKLEKMPGASRIFPELRQFWTKKRLD